MNLPGMTAQFQVVGLGAIHLETQATRIVRSWILRLASWSLRTVQRSLITSANSQKVRIQSERMFVGCVLCSVLYVCVCVCVFVFV